MVGAQWLRNRKPRRLAREWSEQSPTGRHSGARRRPGVPAAAEPLRGDSREDFGRGGHSFGVTRRADRIAMAKRVGYPLTSYNLKMDRSS